jgi:putative transposase
MKKSKYTDKQIAFAVKQTETGITRRRSLSEDGHLPGDAVQLEKEVRWAERERSSPPKQLEDENNRLKKLVVDLSLDKGMLQEVLRKSSEGAQAARAGRLADPGLQGQHETRLVDPAPFEFVVLLQGPSARRPRGARSDQGDRRRHGCGMGCRVFRC